MGNIFCVFQKRNYNKISPGAQGNSWHAGTNIPYTSEERDNRGASESPGFYSNVFLVRKASGGWLPVIDLKSLNAHICAPHFVCSLQAQC